MQSRPRTRLRIGALLLASVLATAACAEDEEVSPQLTVAEAEAERQIGRPVSLRLDYLNTVGEWAFLLAQMQAPDGGRFEYTGTYLEQAAAEGGASDVFCALMRQEAGDWAVIRSCLGATDVAWQGWDIELDLPESLFLSGDDDS